MAVWNVVSMIRLWLITVSRVVLSYCRGSPAGTLTTLSSPTGVAGPAHNTPTRQSRITDFIPAATFWWTQQNTSCMTSNWWTSKQRHASFWSNGPKVRKHDVIQKTGSTSRIATASEKARATAIGNKHKQFVEVRKRSFRVMREIYPVLITILCTSSGAK